mgnify:FL=1|tara:strand:+ start:104 stop:610 length:507 start_codon:yes stop_codon:yes gene_type:complete
MCKDTYILRLTNTVIGNEAAILNTTKDIVSIRIPAHLRNKGKCSVKVISIHIALQNAAAARVVANGVNIIGIRSNIPQLGHSNELNGPNQILGSAIIPADTTRVVAVDTSDALNFTCPKLPDVIELERVCYDHANNFNLIAANAYTTNTVPYQVTLQITFDEDDKHDM